MAIKIRKDSLYAATVGRTQEPMVIGESKSGNVCLLIADDIQHAKRLVGDHAELAAELRKRHADAIQRGYDDDSPFILV